MEGFAGGHQVPNGPETDEQRLLRINLFQRWLTEYESEHKIEMPSSKATSTTIAKTAEEVERDFHTKLYDYWHESFKKRVAVITGGQGINYGAFDDRKEVCRVYLNMYRYKILLIDDKLSKSETEVLEELEKRLKFRTRVGRSNGPFPKDEKWAREKLAEIHKTSGLAPRPRAYIPAINADEH
ncbi:hypothetical protein B7494_g7970 [Chlorociboria aeruginascens]|nr:hypothetical protein B7494_g7970 [Chlorociboria aeruginascens]